MKGGSSCVPQPEERSGELQPGAELNTGSLHGHQSEQVNTGR